MRVAFADPPYIGQAVKHYSDDPHCAEVDHRELIKGLLAGFPEGWALSCSSVSLEQIHQITFELCAGKTRIGSWVKPFCSFKPNVNPAYTWEPVLFFGGRKRGREALTTKDHLIEQDDALVESITLRKGLAGVKPQRFSFWLFDMLGLEPEDDFIDLFPGSGAVGRAWEVYKRRHSVVPMTFQFEAVRG